MSGRISSEMGPSEMDASGRVLPRRHQQSRAVERTAGEFGRSRSVGEARMAQRLTGGACERS